LGTDSRRGPLKGRRWFRLVAGPLFTLAWAVGVEMLRSTPLHVPGTGVSLLVAVAWSAFTGGFVPGFISAAIALGYALHYYSVPPTGITPDDLRHILDLGIGSSLIVVMLGLLRRRAGRVRRRVAEAAVADEYRVVFEEAADPVLLADAAGRYVFVNQRACEVTGYTREELMRLRVGDLFAQEPSTPDALRSAGPDAADRVQVEVDLVRRDGTRLRAELSVRHLDDGRTLKIVRDVTERRAAVERLERALSLVNATLESTTDGILVVDHDGRWTGHNSMFRAIWRIPEEISDDGDDMLAFDHVVAQVTDPEGFVACVRGLAAAPEASSHDEVLLADGRTIERYSIPQRVGDRTVGRVWSFRDVTESRRQAETLRETERRFIQAEKLEAVGRLAGGVAHDFNNMLTAILGEADLLLLQTTLGEHPRAQVENIRSAALRSARLTRQLLAFARRQHTTPRPFALGEVLEGLDPLIRRLAGRQVEVSVDVPKDGTGPWVFADPSQFEQAILNLVINAGDAMPEGGTLRVSVCRDAVPEADVARRGAPRAGRYACVCVADSGTGIPADVRPHLFEPFFTTKPPGKGTGLGLASVHGVVQQANGFVEVQSEEGEGTKFRVLLPEYVDDSAGEQAPAEKVPAAASPRAASVLVVDDEQHVRSLVVTVLSNAGYDVLQADSAAAAIELARVRSAPIELLLSDVLMPGTGGPELARTLVAQRRVRRVMFMSGFPGRAFADDPNGLGAAVVVHKPFRSHELLASVRLALEGADTTLAR
jgi:PAS domain S-box-containing protein